MQFDKLQVGNLLQLNGRFSRLMCVRGTVLLTHSQRSPLRDDAKSGEPETVIGEDISE